MGARRETQLARASRLWESVLGREWVEEGFVPVTIATHHTIEK